MTLIRKWSATIEHGIQKVTITFECPFFDEFVIPNGALTRDFEAHALWDYYGAALKAYDMFKKNLVYEDELSRVFDQKTARNLFISIANKHGVRPDKMVRFWPMIHRQRIAMGGKDQLPEQFQFHYWGV